MDGFEGAARSAAVDVLGHVILQITKDPSEGAKDTAVVAAGHACVKEWAQCAGGCRTLTTMPRSTNVIRLG